LFINKNEITFPENNLQGKSDFQGLVVYAKNHRLESHQREASVLANFSDPLCPKMPKTGTDSIREGQKAVRLTTFPSVLIKD
jgi:hypothetical protein